MADPELNVVDGMPKMIFNITLGQIIINPSRGLAEESFLYERGSQEKNHVKNFLRPL